MKPYSSTGDGILTALIIAEEMTERNTSLSNLCESIILFPQSNVNYKVKNKHDVMNDQIMKDKVSTFNDELHPQGRIILRASGTEDLIRLLVEASEHTLGEKYLKLITDLLKERGHLI
jgi:phosphoglucosamine mutase